MQNSKALQDFIQSSKNYPVWLYLAWHEVKSKYRRTVLGPLWVVLSTSITIAGMGLVWGYLFKMDLSTFFPYLAAGMVCWNLMMMILTESPELFSLKESLIKSWPIPYSMLVYAFIARHFILFFHNILIFIAVALIFRSGISYATPLFFLGLVAYFISGLSISFIFGILGARLRDIVPVIVSVVMLAFFVTPVMWKTEMLQSRAYLALMNPLTHYLDVLRKPLLGELPSNLNYTVVAACTLFLALLAALLFNRFRARIVYWI